MSCEGTFRQMSQNLFIFPPDFPVKPIQYALFSLPNFKDFMMFFEFPLPLKPMSISPLEK